MLTIQDVVAELEKSFPGAEIKVRDLTATGDAFECRISSSIFAGLAIPAQHLKIYEALDPWIRDGKLHALSLLTQTPGGSTSAPAPQV